MKAKTISSRFYSNLDYHLNIIKTNNLFHFVYEAEKKKKSFKTWKILWFGWVYLFNGVSILYGLLNAEIGFICKCWIIINIIYIFNFLM